MILLIVGICESTLLNFIPETKTPPSARSNAFMDYSEPLSSLIIFGGIEDITFLNDIWEFTLEHLTWNEILVLSTAKPCNFYKAPREAPGGATVSPDRKLYIFGGNSDYGPETDLWEFNFDSLQWNIIETFNTPLPRSYFGFAKYVEADIYYLVIQGGYEIELRTNDMYR